MTTTPDPHTAFNSALDGLQAAADQTATAAINANMVADDHTAPTPPSSRPIAALLSPPLDFGIPESNLTWDFGDFLGPKFASQRVHELDAVADAVEHFIGSLADEERMECEEGIGCALADYDATEVARLLVNEHDLPGVLKQHWQNALEGFFDAAFACLPPPRLHLPQRTGRQTAWKCLTYEVATGRPTPT